jgi:ABC-type phosphate transport system substrate-binding protein
VRKLWKLAGVTSLAVATFVGGWGVQVASAAGPPSGYGFDNTPQTVADGGSDTTYKAMTGISDLYNGSALAGCPKNFGSGGVGASINLCKTPSPDANANLGDYDGDVITQLAPAGSSAGIGSLNGYHTNAAGVDQTGGLGEAYAGALEPAPAQSATYPCVDNFGGQNNVDMARSSRSLINSAPPNKADLLTTTGFGGAACNQNEKNGDTAWGFAQDGVTVVGFGARGNTLKTTNVLTPNIMFQIYNCDITNWNQIPGSGAAGPIVPWGMNSSSGTFGTFNTWLINKGGAPSGFTVNDKPCHRKLIATGVEPLENDIKPLVSDFDTSDPDAQGSNGLHNCAACISNPENWIWFGSFGVFSAFPFTSSVNHPVSGTGTQITAQDAQINGVLPNGRNILCNPPLCSVPWTIQRVLWHVTRKGDADCPHVGGIVTNACDTTALAAGPALPAGHTGNDLNVTGGTSGVSGAIREFTRFLCRANANEQGLDPFTGISYDTEISGAIQSAGFTVVGNSNLTNNTRCDIDSQP